MLARTLERISQSAGRLLNDPQQINEGAAASEPKGPELRELNGRLLQMLNLDSLVPGVRLYVLRKRGIFKTVKSRRGEYSFSKAQIDEIEHRFVALEPYLRA